MHICLYISCLKKGDGGAAASAAVAAAAVPGLSVRRPVGRGDVHRNFIDKQHF